jgi:fructosamine-3-kinase
VNDALRRAIEDATATRGKAQWHGVGPTGWGDAWSLATGAHRYFVKTASGRHADMLACEADGLRAIADTKTLRVPAVVACERIHASAFLAMEWLDMRRSADDAAFGRALAQLHRAPASRGPPGERFGWQRDNWIGGTPQPNVWGDNWCAFFRDRRLAPQLALAASRGFTGALQRDGAQLLAAMPELMQGHVPTPSLVHGDLWSGNVAMLPSGEPVDFDPAVYVGDREVDVAMTELFGGFGSAFTRAYAEVAPLDAGYSRRCEIYNLYHLLNHLNLFGASYLARCERTLARILGASGDGLTAPVERDRR